MSAIFLLVMFFSMAQARVIDHLIDCPEVSFEGTLEVVRPDANDIDPKTEGIHQKTEISFIENPTLIEPITISSTVIQAQIVPLFVDSYYSVNLTMDPQNQIFISSIASDDRVQVSFSTSIDQPTHLFVIDINQDKKQDIIVGKINEKVVEYQVLINRTFQIPNVKEGIRLIFDTLTPIKQVVVNDDATDFPQEWCVSIIGGKPALTIYVKDQRDNYGDYMISYPLDEKGDISSPKTFFGNMGRLQSEAFVVDEIRFPQLVHFDFLSLYKQVEGQKGDNYIVFEDINGARGCQNTSVFENNEVPEGYQITQFFLPSQFEGQIAFLYTNPQMPELAPLIQFVNLTEFDETNGVLHWEVQDMTAFNVVPRIIHKIMKGSDWYYVMGADKLETQRCSGLKNKDNLSFLWYVNEEQM